MRESSQRQGLQEDAQIPRCPGARKCFTTGESLEVIIGGRHRSQLWLKWSAFGLGGVLVEVFKGRDFSARCRKPGEKHFYARRNRRHRRVLRGVRGCAGALIDRKSLSALIVNVSAACD